MIRRIMMLLFFSLFFVSCATSPRVLELTEKTSANIGQLQVQIIQMASEQTKVARLRAEALAQFSQRLQESRRSLERGKALFLKTDPKVKVLLKDLNGWLDSLKSVDSDIKSEEELNKTIFATQKKLEPKSQELAKTAKLLAELAKEDLFKKRVAFLAGYGKEVTDLMDENKKKANTASESAKKSSDSIKAATANEAEKDKK